MPSPEHKWIVWRPNQAGRAKSGTIMSKKDGKSIPLKGCAAIHRTDLGTSSRHFLALEPAGYNKYSNGHSQSQLAPARLLAAHARVSAQVSGGAAFSFAA